MSFILRYPKNELQEVGIQRQAPHILIRPEAYQRLVELKKKTGYSISWIASSAILYALEDLSIETEEKKEE